MQGRRPVRLVDLPRSRLRLHGRRHATLMTDSRGIPVSKRDHSSRDLPTFHPSTIESAECGAPGSWGVSVTALLKLGCTVRQIRSAPDDTLLLLHARPSSERKCGAVRQRSQARNGEGQGRDGTSLGPERPRHTAP
ncbi:hypothetical protein CEP54_002642 [Fusarium duplospermum]|uniref:Uncharacterized protein n=1 Tax=Fusarium duplospermum TaxID=1325734 RepID=A0A428QTQ3_9HYPO|nr:hypothetical protein CEP54_002642 [Fusarium duplospermum]